MSLITLALSIICLTVIFLFRNNITSFLNDKLNTTIQSEWIVYIVSILFVIVIMLAMLLDTKQSSIGKGFDAIKPSNTNKPHRYFDVNTN